MTATLPSFNKPPVVEVVMGVQFSPLRRFLSPYFGKLWTLVENEYPNCSEHSRLVPQIEDFDTPHALKKPKLEIEIGGASQPPRVFFEDDSGNWLIQVQRDRFLHNWRVAENDSEYPRFPEVSRRFFEQWYRFESFLNENDLGEIQISQLEITYFNQIPLASTMIGEVFPDCVWRTGDRELSTPEAVEIGCSFRSENSPRRLRTTAKPVVHHGNREMVFELTVRGERLQEESLEDWFAAGRAWIVSAFADMTAPQWHERWERTA